MVSPIGRRVLSLTRTLPASISRRTPRTSRPATGASTRPSRRRPHAGGSGGTVSGSSSLAASPTDQGWRVALVKSYTKMPYPTPAGSLDLAIWKAIRLPSSLTTGLDAL